MDVLGVLGCFVTVFPIVGHPESTSALKGEGGRSPKRVQKCTKGRGVGESPSVRTSFKKFY